MSQAEPPVEKHTPIRQKNKTWVKSLVFLYSLAMHTYVFSSKEDRMPHACHMRTDSGEWMIMQPEASFDTHMHLAHLLWQAYQSCAQIVSPLCTSPCRTPAAWHICGQILKTSRGRPTGVVSLKVMQREQSKCFTFSQSEWRNYSLFHLPTLTDILCWI